MNFIRLFSLSRERVSIKREITAGLTTFSTMAYIIIVNPLILSKTGMEFSSVMLATILVSAMATFLMAIIGRYPFALAPGMSMNAYFAYSVVLGLGVPWQTALGVVFLASILLLILWMARARQFVIQAIPFGIKVATTAGIGLFLIVTALNNARIIVTRPKAFLAVGNLVSPEALFTFFGILVITALLARGVRAALLIGILVNWAGGIILGFVQWEGIVDFPSYSTAAIGALDIRGALAPNLWMAIFAFVFILLFDSTGSLMGLTYHGGFADKEGKFRGMQRALLPDILGTMGGAWMGTSPTVVFMESASGIAAGGKTGVTALTVSILFLLALFFEPLASSIPPFAVTPVLFVVGAMMMKTLKSLQFRDPTEWIPALAAFVAIPLTYNVGMGIGLGMVLYPFGKLLAGKAKEAHPLTWLIAALFLAALVL